MEIIDSSSAFPLGEKPFTAGALIGGEHGNVRVIRLAPGQALPPHTHGASDLFLQAFEGDGMLLVDGEEQRFAAGMVAHLLGTDELRVRNTGESTMTLFAFLAPVFPPAA